MNTSLHQPVIDPWLLERIACPRDHGPLSVHDNTLRCEQGHEYPVIEGVPVLLLDNVPQTLWVAGASIEQSHGAAHDPWYLGTLGISDEERADLQSQIDHAAGGIDPLVSFLIGATNGIAYRHLIGKLQEYPIPHLRLPPGGERVLLDVGCNWGRWSIAAARLGYQPIGIDPSLGAVLAAQRVAKQLGVRAHFVAGDARFLPFPARSIDVAFSYSVIQHLSRENAANAVNEIGRVLKPGGTSLVQMPTTYGIRCLQHQMRRRFREAREFEVRYWTVPALLRMFREGIGPSRFSVDCYFGIGLQASDLRVMPWTHRVVIRASEALRKISGIVPPIKYVADSVYIESVRAG